MPSSRLDSFSVLRNDPVNPPAQNMMRAVLWGLGFGAHVAHLECFGPNYMHSGQLDWMDSWIEGPTMITYGLKNTHWLIIAYLMSPFTPKSSSS